MKFGHFDDLNREYVIETPQTPLPWINYLGNEDFFSIISNTGGGYSFYKDAKLRRITRFRYNNVPRDSGGRLYYICDESEEQNKIIWSPCYKPCMTKLDSYKCRHGQSYTIFESQKNNVNAELLCFVPLNSDCEINSLTIRNNDLKPKKITVFGAIEWCLWNTIDDSTNFQRNYNIGEVEVENSVIYHKTEYRERRNHYAFYSVNHKTKGFDTDRDSFLGQFSSWEMPEVVKNLANTNSIASGWAPIACHSIEIQLEPSEEKNFVFILGYIENEQDKKFAKEGIINKEKAQKLINKFSNKTQIDTAFAELRDYWSNLLKKFQIKSNDPKFDRMINIWNQYQCMVTFNMSRSASYFESGTGRGMGFRDSCQDLLGFVHLIPERARERILDIAAIQSKDGSTYHQYQPLTKRGNADVGSGFNDDPLWLVACTVAYIKETGDFSILDESVEYQNQAGSNESLFCHLQKSINYTINHKGPHSLPLIGRADWNDCLNLNCFSENPGESFQTCSNFESGKAESVFIAGMFVKYGREYAELCRHIENDFEATRIDMEVEKICQAVETSGWDGQWFIRAYDAFSNKIGSNECSEGKIFIEPQGFCTMAQIGKDKSYGKKALLSVEKYLENDYGIELLSPCYTKYHKELGEISSYPPGYKENGSVFCHNNPWIVLAYTTIKNGDKAFKCYKKNCPAYIEDKSEIHKTEPYVYSQTIAGRDAKNYGEAKNSWLTGTAAWTFTAASQGILGIIPCYDGLKIEPVLPPEITEICISRIFRGAKFNINIKDSKQQKSQNIIQVYLDGAKIEGNIVHFDKQKTEYNIDVLM